MDMVDTDQLNSDNVGDCNHTHNVFEHSLKNKDFVPIGNDLGLDHVQAVHLYREGDEEETSALEM